MNKIYFSLKRVMSMRKDIIKGVVNTVHSIIAGVVAIKPLAINLCNSRTYNSKVLP